MDRKYWEKIAPAYSDEIFDVLHNDKKAIIRKAIKKVASPDATVLDAGCAIGKWIPVIAPLFKKVVAADISAKNLAIAKNTFTRFTNVDYSRIDMSSSRAKLDKYDTIICVNAILTDVLKKRSVFFTNLGKSLKKSGHLVLVVPSLESWLLSSIIQHQWSIDKSLFKSALSAAQGLKKYNAIRQGNADIDEVPTKHYLKDELALLLSREKIAMTDCRKIEYSWDTEFNKPPSWLNEPKPWDWMVIGKKL